METVFVLFGVWKDTPERLIGVFKTKLGMLAEIHWINTHEAPYSEMRHIEVGLKD